MHPHQKFDMHDIKYNMNSINIIIMYPIQNFGFLRQTKYFLVNYLFILHGVINL